MYNGQCITGCHKRILIAQYFIRFMLKGAMTGVTSTSSFMPRTAAVPREACEINLTNHPNFSVGSSLLFIRSVYVINLNLKSFLLAQLQIIYCKNFHGNILKWYFLFHASISITIDGNIHSYIHIVLFNLQFFVHTEHIWLRNESRCINLGLLLSTQKMKLDGIEIFTAIRVMNMNIKLE